MGTYVGEILCIVFNVGIVKISAVFELFCVNERNEKEKYYTTIITQEGYFNVYFPKTNNYQVKTKYI